jgi:hypothetical protein
MEKILCCPDISPDNPKSVYVILRAKFDDYVSFSNPNIIDIFFKDDFLILKKSDDNRIVISIKDIIWLEFNDIQL